MDTPKVIEKQRTLRNLIVAVLVLLVGVGIWLEYRLLGLNLRPPMIEPYLQYGYSPLKIGRTVPYFQIKTASGQVLTPLEPPAKFYLFVLDDRLPSACLNMECGPGGGFIASKGGTLMGIADPGIAGLFGIGVDQNPSPIDFVRAFEFERARLRLQGEPLVRFDARFVVAADHHGRVRKVFRNGTLQDLGRVVQESGFADPQ